MKTSLTPAVLTLLAMSCCAVAQSTTFSYQGSLAVNGQPAQGTYDLRFELFIDPTESAISFGPIDHPATPVNGGRFTVPLDFGGTPFHGGDYWLGISVKTNGAAGYQALTPRQLITPVPNAITAWSILPDGLPAGDYLNALSFLSANNQFVGDGSGLTGLNASAITSGVVPAVRLDPAITKLGPTIESTEISDAAVFAPANHDHHNWYWKVSGNAVGGLGGTPVLGTTDNEVLTLQANGQAALRLQPAPNSPNVIGGYSGNIVSNGFFGAFIGGGGNSSYPNRVGGSYAAVLGGWGNIASGSYSQAMGYQSTASGTDSTAIGNNVRATGWGSLAMGTSTLASGNYSTALGVDARALHYGSFVWADGLFGDFDSTADNQFSVQASGGFRLSDNTPSISFGATTRQMLDLYNQDYAIGVQSGTLYQRSNNRFSWFRGGVHSDTQNDPGTGGVVAMTLTSSGLTVNGTFVSTSDRNAKQDFQPVNAGEVLGKVLNLPVSEWSYRSDEERSRHVGPMAQDFRAAFGLGADDKHIATVDADGVALAAIQGLNQKLEARLQARDQEIEALKSALEELRARLDQVQHAVSPIIPSPTLLP